MKNQEQLHAIAAWLGSGSINIFGRPFAGKDTQGRYLARTFHGVLMGGGEILRSGTVPDHVQKHLKAGRLIPSEDYVAIVLPHLSQPAFEGKPLILSSVGRWHGEEAGVLRATEAAGHPLKAVIYLNLSEDTVRERWRGLKHHDDRGNRYDDTADILEIRLAEFRTKTLPVIDYYREAGLLIEVEGTATPEVVGTAILEKLAEHAQQTSHV